MIATTPASKRSWLPRWWRRAVLTMCLLAAYPGFVLATTYAIVLGSQLPGGRHGPQDAYRHSLASAIVAYTGSPRWVEWATVVMENRGRGNTSRAMDAHNNRIGARIGTDARSWGEMRADVLSAVRAGSANADSDERITWLPPERWQERLY